MAFRQDLSKAKGGTIQGRGGNSQTLGAAAQRRLAGRRPSVSGGGMATKPAGMPLRRTAAPPVVDTMEPQPASLNGGGLQGTTPYSDAGGGALLRDPDRDRRDRLRASGMDGFDPQTGFEGPNDGMPDGLDPRIMEAAMRRLHGGGMQGPGGMASYLKPGFGAASGAAGPPGITPKPMVNSNPFAAEGGTPSGEPLDAAMGRGGQAGRIAALIARLRGGGGAGGGPQAAIAAAAQGAGQRLF